MEQENVAQNVRVLDGVLKGWREHFKGGIAWRKDGKRTWPSKFADRIADGFQSGSVASLGDQATECLQSIRRACKIKNRYTVGGGYDLSGSNNNRIGFRDR